MAEYTLLQRLRTMGRSNWHPIGNEAADEIEKLLAVVEAAQEWLDSEDDDQEYFAVRKLTSALALVSTGQTHD